MNIERMKAMVADKAAAAKLAECKTLEDLVACLNKAGVDCTMEDGVAILKAIKNSAADNGSMDLDDMDAVAGGGLGDFFSSLLDYISPAKLLEDLKRDDRFDDKPRMIDPTDI